ncbi:MAG: TIR domain-containing protein [Methylococcaceae bacterium]|nr:TIR domain-containing protein [Methylococcaceae bacterium]
MSRIFLSHSSIDELEAVALKVWLAKKGWDDVFLDLDPKRGLIPGKRWREELYRAGDRCEAVVCVITPAWTQSKWCLTEGQVNKRIFGLIVKPVDKNQLPTDLTAEWQLCHLAGNGPKETIVFTHKEQAQQVEFLSEGLTRLRIGLENAGLDAYHFPWPPPDELKRPPYRGWKPLDDKDAAIYFGRDAQIVRGLDALRGMRATGVETLFVILGPSGCGKSSFLRAGLLPRLKRDDRHFLSLEVIRPERQALTGEHGLANALHKAFVAFGLSGQTLGAIKSDLMQDPSQLAPMLNAIQRAARERLRVDNEEPAPLTLLLSVDQAEELFNPDATGEARRFLALLGASLRDTGAERPSLIVAFTVRSDRYEPLQTARELAGLRSVVFDDLKPMLSQQFKEIIIGPAQRATEAGNRLETKSDLVEQLLRDCTQGADTLPLLSLTLSRLYDDYGSDGDLRLDEYQAMGGIGSVVKSEVESVLAHDDTAQRESQLAQLRAAFIPWLATINPQNDEPMRRLARYADLPAECHKLVDALAEKRLLLIDQRNGEKVVEVAHESLLRQWEMLAGWLVAEGKDLKLAHALEQATQDWERNGRKAAWLWMGERLSSAEGLAAKPGFGKRLDNCREFLLASLHAEDAKRAEEEQRRTFNKKVLEDLVINNSHIALTIMWNAAISLTDEGNLALLEDVVETSVRSLGNNHPDTIARKLSLANTLRSRGEINRAKKIENEARQHTAKAGIFDHDTHDRIERSLKDIDWAGIRRPMYFPSPSAWEDQVLYFLMLDRYSDGKELGYRDNTGNMIDNGSTPPFKFDADAYNADLRLWSAAGADWLGGTLKGLESKIGYLARLGVTTLWISPPFKQVAFDCHAYHGRNIQNFLDVDPHFGTRQDFIDLVRIW